MIRQNKNTSSHRPDLLDEPVMSDRLCSLSGGSNTTSLTLLHKEESSNQSKITRTKQRQEEPLQKLQEECSTKKNSLTAMPATTPRLFQQRFDMTRLRDRWWELMQRHNDNHHHHHHLNKTKEEEITTSSVAATSSSSSANDGNEDSDAAERHETTPIHNTCEEDVEESTRALQEHYNTKCNEDDHQDDVLLPNSYDYYTDSEDPVLEAVLQNDPDALQYYMKRRTTADCHQAVKRKNGGSSMSPLQLATQLDRPRLVRLLVSGSRKGCNHVKDNPNFTPALLLAAQHGLEECLQIILMLSGSLSARDSATGNNVLHAACGPAVPSSILEQILCYGSATKKLLVMTNNRQQNPLHVACANGRVDLVDTFLQQSSSISISVLVKALAMQDVERQTPFLAAVAAGCVDVVMSLLMWRGNNHCHASSAASGPCPLAWAVRAQNVGMVQLLLEFNDPTSCGGGGGDGGGYDLTLALHGAVCAMKNNEEEDEELLEIMRVLVQAGANPCTSSSGDNPSAIELATTQKQPSVVAALLGSYTHFLAKARMARRRDTHLSRQPESFFAGLESRENAERTVVLRNALVSSLLANTSACSLVLYQRGARLGSEGFYRLCTNLVSNRSQPDVQNQVVSLLSGSFLYQGRYKHALGTSAKDRREAIRYWSQTMERQPFALPARSIGCPWIGDDSMAADEFPSPDFVLVANDGTRFYTHSTILSQKSEKLEAAFRFTSMSHPHHEDDSVSEVQVDLPSKMCVWLLHHIYHGSLPRDVWSGSSDSARENLLQLLLLGDQYICASLVLECELRLLSLEERCFCWYCCSRTVVDQQGRWIECFNQTEKHQFNDAKQSHVQPEYALDILAVAQHVGESMGSGDAADYGLGWMEDRPRQQMMGYSNDEEGVIPLYPMEALRLVAIQTILQDFEQVVKSSSFRSQLPGEEDGAEKLLLEMCLEELESILSSLAMRRQQPTAVAARATVSGTCILSSSC